MASLTKLAPGSYSNLIHSRKLAAISYRMSKILSINFGFSILKIQGLSGDKAKNIVTAPIGQIRSFASGLKNDIVTFVKDAYSQTHCGLCEKYKY